MQAGDRQLGMLEPSAVHASWCDNGLLCVTIEGDELYSDVAVVRCFPQSVPDQFWALTDKMGKPIGVIADPKGTGPESHGAMLEALRQRYFRPVITAIRSLKVHTTTASFEVDTDRGPRRFVTKVLRECFEELDDGQLMIVDADENRYQVPDWRALDAVSRQLLKGIL